MESNRGTSVNPSHIAAQLVTGLTNSSEASLWSMKHADLLKDSEISFLIVNGLLKPNKMHQRIAMAPTAIDNL